MLRRVTESVSPYLKRLLGRLGPATPEGPAVGVVDEASARSAEPELRRIPRAFSEKDLDPFAVKVVRTLVDGGHEAYLVGGCVRDLLFGAVPKDFDLVTSAHPHQVKRLVRNCRIIGRRFKLAHVYSRDKIIEVATFRAGADRGAGASEASERGKSADSDLIIRDDNVFGNAEQDAVRRDFTINALLYDVNREEILDYIRGVEDAEERLIRTIGDPDLRMREDPIRMLRAIRLGARLGCRIDEATWSAIERHRAEILEAATPRIGEELRRMGSGGAIAPALDMMLASGVLEIVLPEIYVHLESAVRDGRVDQVEALRAHLARADAWTLSGRPISSAVMFAMLLSPFLMEEPAEDSGIDHSTQLVERLRPIAQRLSITRRECERIRLVLLAQDKLVPRKRRRRGATALLRRAYLSDALDFFETMCEATGDCEGEPARWRERLAETEAAAPPKADKPARRRRAPRRRPRNAPAPAAD